MTATRIRDAHCSISMLDELKCQSGENTSDITSYTLYNIYAVSFTLKVSQILLDIGTRKS